VKFRHVKRIFDLVIGGALLLLLIPLFPLIALILYVSLKESPFFVQHRPGKGNKLFPMYKFKTMSSLRDSENNLLPDEIRLTKTGSLVRKCSLDELPQLFNVVCGHMSLIGPRPQLQEYIEQCTPYQAQRQNVRPGLTGLAQIKGRNHLSWDRRFRYDVFYTKKMSPKLDVYIFVMTFVKVLMGSGVEYQGSVAENKFSQKQKTSGTNEPQIVSAMGKDESGLVVEPFNKEKSSAANNDDSDSSLTITNSKATNILVATSTNTDNSSNNKLAAMASR
jgi:lipopolysaccharide/colanic/teichoic acid biosynthesis glycosyltransferase